MSLLEELPVELLHRICSFLEPDVWEFEFTSDIRNFRLANRLLAVVGAEHLLQEVTLFFARDDFQKAREIARSHVAKGIRSLCFEPARLEYYPDFKTWEMNRDRSPEFRKKAHAYAAIDLADESDMEQSARGQRRIMRNGAKARDTRRHFSKAMLRKAFAAYRSAYADQVQLENDKEAQHALYELFKACPKLDRVIMTMANEIRATSHGKHVPAFQRAMVTPFCDESRGGVGVHALTSLLVAAHGANRALKSLHVNPISHTFFELEQDKDQVLEVLGSIEELQIGLNASYHDENCNTDEVALGLMLQDLSHRHIPRFLSHASKLRSLSIKGPMPDDPDHRVCLNTLVGNLTWPLLTRLELYEFQCTESELRNVIVRHQETLKELELAQVLLVEGDADNLFKSIAGKLKHLRDVELWGTFEARQGQSLQFDDAYIDSGNGVFKRLMEEYVVEGGEMPDPEEDWEEYDDDDDEEEEFEDFFGGDDPDMYELGFEDNVFEDEDAPLDYLGMPFW